LGRREVLQNPTLCDDREAQTQKPVIVASGTFGFGEEYEDFIELDRLGDHPKGIS